MAIDELFRRLRISRGQSLGDYCRGGQDYPKTDRETEGDALDNENGKVDRCVYGFAVFFRSRFCFWLQRPRR